MAGRGGTVPTKNSLFFTQKISSFFPGPKIDLPENKYTH